MRLFEAPSAVLSVVAILLTANTASAGPFSRLNELIQQEVEKLSQAQEDLSLQNSTLERRQQCAGTVCGYYGQLCCTGGQTCSTNAQNEAICVAGSGGGSQVTAAAGGGNGQWQYYTSTWVTTGLQTMTTVYSSWIPAQVTSTANGQCDWANNESPCGPKCCGSGDYCVDANKGICKAAGNGGFTTTGVAGGALPPTRPTTISGVLTTVTMTPTTTLPFGTPIATGQSATPIASEGGGGGLSGGAIAGIVIGVIAGLILLILLCLCCCLKAGFDGILALVGLGKNRKRRRVEEEYIESHRRYGSQGGSRRWYGSAAGGGRPARPPPSEKHEGMGGLAKWGLGLGGLAVALGLKRKHDRRHDDKSDISSSYYSSYYTSSSSDNRTRRSSRR